MKHYHNGLEIESRLSALKQNSLTICLNSDPVTSYELCMHGGRCNDGLFNTFPGNCPSAILNT